MHRPSNLCRLDRATAIATLPFHSEVYRQFQATAQN